MTGKTSKAKAEAVTGANSENGPDIIQPEKFDLRSHSISEEKRRELLRLFPEVRTEGEKADFNRLKLALGESVDTGKERYGLMWPGKADCFKAIQTPSLGTLLPVPEESVNWDTTENLIIEGDNLEVLKLLQKSYMGKVKMIYIDPPYNTGNDFIYPDDYSESLQTYLEYTGQVDSQGKKFSTNSDTEGRFHSKWGFVGEFLVRTRLSYTPFDSPTSTLAGAPLGAGPRRKSGTIPCSKISWISTVRL